MHQNKDDMDGGGSSSNGGDDPVRVRRVPGVLSSGAEDTRRVHSDMKDELKDVLGGCWRYHASRQGTRFDKLKLVGIAQAGLPEEETTTTVVRKGAKLGNKLMEMASEGRGQDLVWELASCWPSSGRS